MIWRVARKVSDILEFITIHREEKLFYISFAEPTVEKLLLWSRQLFIKNNYEVCGYLKSNEISFWNLRKHLQIHCCGLVRLRCR